MAELGTDVRYIKGIGEQRALSLNKLGIYTLRDLVTYFPRAYDDRSVIKPICDVTFGENVCVSATVATQPALSHIRKGLDIVRLRAVDEKNAISITFFNQSYVKNQLQPGETYIFYGRIGGRIGMPEMTNPVFEREDRERTRTGRIVPIYRLTAGISQNVLAYSIRQGLAACGELLPEALVRKEISFEHHLLLRMGSQNAVQLSL